MIFNLDEDGRDKGVRIVDDNFAASCYFRTSVKYPQKKVLLQVTEQCNLNCAHCFISSTLEGKSMDFYSIEKIVLPSLIKLNAVKITLTGGEPFLHSRIIDIAELFVKNDIKVGICTNATLISKSHIDELEKIKNVHINVSLDGFSNTSHGKFRGNENLSLFNRIVTTIETLGDKGLLQGILVTPNLYAKIEEYEEICNFAYKSNAKYVLMNPLSNLGRGQMSKEAIGMPSEFMRQIRSLTNNYINKGLEVDYIRFPNDKGLPLQNCIKGNILYIFTNGDITVCPYMAFAARNESSKYNSRDFIVGNIFKGDSDILTLIEKFKLPCGAENSYCDTCKLNQICGRGCLAAKISSGKYLYEVDEELCPSVLLGGDGIDQDGICND